jgi:hypothetical protein
MDTVIINIILSLLGKVLTPELVKKYESVIIAFLQAELAQAPELLHKAEEYVVCKLYALAKTTGTGIDDAVVQVVANALSVDTSKCPV